MIKVQKEIKYGLIGLVIGVLIAVFVASSAVNNSNQGMMKMMGMNTEKMMGSNQDNMKGMESSMKMMKSLEGKTGDEFDEAFLAAMIEHHQSAIDMANQAKMSAKRDEIKTMADDIISAQTKEIDQMKQWQKDWGY